MDKIIVPKLYEDSNTIVQNIIKTLGTNIYIKLKLNTLTEADLIETFLKVNKNDNNLFEKKINDLTETNTHLEKQIKQKDIEAEKRIEEIINVNKKDYNYKIEQLTNNLFDSETNREKIIEKKEYEMKTMYEHLLREKDKDLKHKSEKIETLEKNEKLYERVFGKDKYEHNTEQGDVGEKLLDDVVNNGLSIDKKATIEDSSKGYGSGDRIITFGNKNMLMVEVKNKGTITKEDMKQFKEHYEKDFSENKCQMALFVSLKSQQIPNIGDKPYLEYKNGIGYIGFNDKYTVEQKKYHLDRCINELYCRFRDENEKINKVDEEENSLYNITLDTLFNKKAKHEDDIKRNEKEKETNERELKECNRQINNIIRIANLKNIEIDKKFHANIDDKTQIDELKNKIKESNIMNDKSVNSNSFRNKITSSLNLTILECKTLKKIKYKDLNFSTTGFEPVA